MTPREQPPTLTSPAGPPWTLYTPVQRRWMLALLFLVSTSAYLDRNIISVLLEPIRAEFGVSDTMLGLLSGFAFALTYAAFGLPVARWADRGNRRTIIALSLALWSGFTALCGLAQTFWQLAAARIGVGVGEAGAIPPAQSLIADYFSPERRAGALAVFTSAATAGYLLGFVVGGWIATHYGWRQAFLVAGIPGLLLALVAWRGLREPREVLGFPAATAPAEPIAETLQRLSAKPSYVYAFVASVGYFFVAYGALIFVPSFLVRVLRVPLTDVSVLYGVASAVGSVVGTLGGGWIANRLGARDARWLGWLPGCACALAAPLYVYAFAQTSMLGFLVPATLAGTLIAAGLPTLFSLFHAVCGSRRRATAIAIVLFAATLLGGGFGPLVTGALSDAWSETYGVDGLRYALMAVISLLLACAAGFVMAGRRMLADQET